jgi:hypothetical protein
VFVVLVVIASVLIIRIPPWSFDPAHVTTMGTVLETRIEVVGSWGGKYGGMIFYQLRARVSYQVGSSWQDRWMPVSAVETSREYLEAQYRRQLPTCCVSWPENFPDNPSCRFEK